MNKIITISREFGSGGRYIGEKVAKKLGIPFFDKAIIERVAKETGLVEDFIERMAEYAPSKNIFAYSFVGRDASGKSIEDYLMNIQRKVILDIANEGPCVIVGRSADFILKDHAETINVFIYGEKSEKLKRIKELNNLDERSALKLIDETDKKRSINYKYYTDRVWGDRRNYTAMLNSTQIGIDRCVDIIASMY